MTVNFITIEDEWAAKFCELAAARLLLNYAEMNRLAAELSALGYAKPHIAAETIARSAIDVEREARDNEATQ
jgi:hypothetical protein